MQSSKERIREVMKNQTLGAMIASLRKQNGLTQLELAEKMGVTDKAVSKWERDLSCPDINTIPKLAELFDVSVDELMQGKKADAVEEKEKSPLINIILTGVALAMGVAVTVLSVLGELDVVSGMGMLGIGLACLAVSLLSKNKS